MTDNNKIKELSALISMMDEPSEVNYNSIREKIASYGKTAIPLLEDAWMKATREDDIDRIGKLIDEIRFNDIYFALENWAKFHSNDLIEAFFILTRFQYPELDEDKYRQVFDRIKKDIWLEINENLTALEKVKVLNHIFYDVYKFRGEIPQQTKISDYCLNHVMDNKKGTAIALGILYISLAQKLNIPIFGVDLHQHFVLAYMDDNQPVKSPEEYTEKEILFYIAIVNKGAAFTKNEIEHYIKKADISSKPSYFLPCSNLIIIERMVTEMVIMHRVDDNNDKAEMLIKLIDALR
ncbi:MAG: hypothetical protein GXO86_05770 [Chlorobi bacterium]|nr:hypothetical protein [Chlorobiota bacterium]